MFSKNCGRRAFVRAKEETQTSTPHAGLQRILAQPPRTFKTISPVLPKRLRIELSHAFSGRNLVERPRPRMHDELKGLQGEFQPKVQERGIVLERDLPGWLPQ